MKTRITALWLMPPCKSMVSDDCSGSYLRYQISRGRYLAPLIQTFDLDPKTIKCYYIQLEFKWMLVANLKKFLFFLRCSCLGKWDAIKLHWPWPLTYGHQNLVSLSLTPSRRSKFEEISSGRSRDIVFIRTTDRQPKNIMPPCWQFKEKGIYTFNAFTEYSSKS